MPRARGITEITAAKDAKGPLEFTRSNFLLGHAPELGEIAHLSDRSRGTFHVQFFHRNDAVNNFESAKRAGMRVRTPERYTMVNEPDQRAHRGPLACPAMTQVIILEVDHTTTADGKFEQNMNTHERLLRSLDFLSLEFCYARISISKGLSPNVASSM